MDLLIGSGTFGKNLAIIIFILGLITFLFQTFRNNKGYNLIMILICLEIILLSIGIFLVNISIGLDDFIGIHVSIFLLALAGCESSIGLALLIAYFPIRNIVVQMIIKQIYMLWIYRSSKQSGIHIQLSHFALDKAKLNTKYKLDIPNNRK